MGNTIKKEKDIVVVTVNSDLILNELKSLEDDVIRILDDENKHIILDLQHVVYLSSLGIHAFIRILKKAEKKLAIIKFVNMHENVKRNLRVIGLLRFVEVFDSEGAALDSFNENVSALEKNLLWE